MVQVPPIPAYGREFPIIPTPARTVGDVIRVMASEPNTNIAVESEGNVNYYEIATVSNYVGT